MNSPGFCSDFGPGGPFLGGRKRGRGDTRAAIIALLAEQPMHGYQIMRELGQRSGGEWRPSPGSVYPTLQQLEDEELVEQQADTGKRIFALTAVGRTLAEQATGEAPWEQVDAEAGDDSSALHDLAHQVLGATEQVVRAGTPAQVRQARALLKETRRGLYRLLAEADEDEAAPTA